VLDVLKANNVKATFFIVGKMAKAHPEMLARIAEEGNCSPTIAPAIPN